MSSPRPVTRIAMWSGPRNISTAMMRSFGNRPDTAWSTSRCTRTTCAATGLDHPGRDEILARPGPTTGGASPTALTGPVPGGRRGLLPEAHDPPPAARRSAATGSAGVTNAFLIRDPAGVVASYAQGPRRADARGPRASPSRSRSSGRARTRLGAAPPVVDAADVLRRPARACSASAVRAARPRASTSAMLRGRPARGRTDGVWAPHWYAAVEASTGFGPSGRGAGRRARPPARPARAAAGRTTTSWRRTGSAPRRPRLPGMLQTFDERNRRPAGQRQRRAPAPRRAARVGLRLGRAGRRRGVGGPAGLRRPGVPAHRAPGPAAPLGPRAGLRRGPDGRGDHGRDRAGRCRPTGCATACTSG